MKIRYPEYYKKFHCLAGECPDTCCVAWEITVDRETAEKYKKFSRDGSRIGKKLGKRIRHGKIVPEGEYCPFLGGDHLCDIYRKYGEEAMCRICRHYPRHMEDYGELHEVLLLISCPEAARLMLTEGEGFLIREKPEVSGNTEGIDGELLEGLLTLRKRLFQVLSDRSRPLDMRMLTVLKLCHDGQKWIRDGKMANMKRLLEEFSADASWEERLEKEYDSLEEKRFTMMADTMAELASFDKVSRKWPAMLEQCRTILYHSPDSRSRYLKDRQEFLKEHPETELRWERICRYFLYSFFLTSLYDGEVYAKGKMAVFCTCLMEDLFLASWRLDERKEIWGTEHPEKTLAEQVKICHVAARQIENSAENRERLEKLLNPSAVQPDNLAGKIGRGLGQLKDQLGGFLGRSHAAYGNFLQ